MKLVGDWISRDAGDLAPSFPAEAFAAAIAAAHEHGAKVTAHCFGTDVLQGLLDAGIDCIEHGTGLQESHLEQMVAGGVALVPTVLQTDKFPGFAEAGRAKFPQYAATMEHLHRQRRATLMAAYEAGVPLYVGSDGGGTGRHGYLAEEIAAMVAMGLPAEYVVGGGVLAWTRVAGLERGARRGRAGRLRGARRRPAHRPPDPGPPGVRGAARERGPQPCGLERDPDSVRRPAVWQTSRLSPARSAPLTAALRPIRSSRPGVSPPVSDLQPHTSSKETPHVSVKIRLKRLGKVRVPQYRIVVVDSRKKRDGKVLEEIGLYRPKEDPSFITVTSDRAQYWLGVGAQPSEAVAKLLKITGDWQTFKGISGTEGTLKVAEPKRSKQDIFNEALKDAANEPKGAAVTKKAAAKKAEKAERQG